MKSFLAMTACAVLAAAASPALAQQKLIPAQSQISFVSTQMGVPVEGQFRRFDAQVAFDPRKPESATVAMSIDLGSVSLGVAEAEAEIAKPDWFASKQFPQASFRSSAVKSVSPGQFQVTGKLAIKGQSRDIVVPVALAQAGANTTATGAFVIKRLDFRIGDGEWKDTSMVANDVQVKFKLTLAGVPAL